MYQLKGGNKTLHRWICRRLLFPGPCKNTVSNRIKFFKKLKKSKFMRIVDDSIFSLRYERIIGRKSNAHVQNCTFQNHCMNAYSGTKMHIYCNRLCHFKCVASKCARIYRCLPRRITQEGMLTLLQNRVRSIQIQKLNTFSLLPNCLEMF